MVDNRYFGPFVGMYKDLNIEKSVTIHASIFICKYISFGYDFLLAMVLCLLTTY